jgi:hypothetical protein
MSMRMRLALALLPGAALVLSALPAGGVEAWRWRDAEGGVHFGDRPPPGAAAERLRLRADPASTGGAQGPVARQAPAPPPPAPADAAADGPQRLERCDRARWALAALESGRPVYLDAYGAYRVKRPPGQPDPYTGPREYLDDAEREQAQARYRGERDEACAEFPERMDPRAADEDLRRAEACERAAADLARLERPEARASAEDLATRRRWLETQCVFQ